jgi:hypothetical protein
MKTLTSSLIAFLLTALVAGCETAGGETDTAVDDSSIDAPDIQPDNPGEDVSAEPDEDAPQDVADGETEIPVVGECGTDSPEALMGCVERERYVTDLTFIEGDRAHADEHWQEVQDLCATRFTELGYQVELYEYEGGGVDVIGTLQGSGSPLEEVLLSAHYDGVPSCEAADDNGSGVAGVLESARVLALAQFNRTIVLACWDQEEDGMLGSAAYATRADTSGEDILISYVFEMIGFISNEPNSQEIPAGLDILFPDQMAWLEANEYRGNFIAILSDDLATVQAVNVQLYGQAVSLLSVDLELTADWKNSEIFNDLRRSDHASFWWFDYPAMMIGDTAEFRNPYYHCAEGPDVIGTLDHDFAVKVIQATIGAAASDLGII